MSILIKGMEMPQDIREAIIITRGGKASRIRAGRIIIEGSVEETNVAIELPPHGRLIDADHLLSIWEKDKEGYREEGLKYCDELWDYVFDSFSWDVKNIKTIVKADKEE